MSEENRRVAIAFFQKALNEFDVPAAIALYGGKSYKQHNPLIEDGWEGLTRFIAWLRTNFPQARLDIKHAYADGDFVVLHSHWSRTPGERGEAVVDIVRLEHGKLVEHWDVIQPISEKAANQQHDVLKYRFIWICQTTKVFICPTPPFLPHRRSTGFVFSLKRGPLLREKCSTTPMTTHRRFSW